MSSVAGSSTSWKVLVRNGAGRDLCAIVYYIIYIYIWKPKERRKRRRKVYIDIKKKKEKKRGGRVSEWAEEKKSGEEIPIPAVETGEEVYEASGVRKRKLVKFHAGIEAENGS